MEGEGGGGRLGGGRGWWREIRWRERGGGGRLGGGVGGYCREM